MYGFFDFADENELVGRMGTFALAWSHLQGGETHQSLVAQGGGAERLSTHLNSSTHQYVVGRTRTGTEAERTCHRCRGNVGLDEFKELFIGVTLVAADVDGEGAAVGYHIVLCAGRDGGNSHLDGTQEW